MPSLLIICITLASFGAEDEDYRDYHKRINEAEFLFFSEEQADSALHHYDRVFEDFDFIFVKDIVNAAQIARYTNVEYEKYLQLAFKFGLKLEHLQSYPLFSDDYQSFLSNTQIQKAFKVNREIYLQSIDYEYLNWMYFMGLKDQKDKYQKDYDKRIIYKSLMHIRDSIRTRGFPGDRLIGIADSTVLKDAGRKEHDVNRRAEELNLRWVKSDDEILSQKWIFNILIHNYCSYYLLEELLLEEMAKGNIHPRDIGLIYDNTLRVKSLPEYCGKVHRKGAYHLNLFVPKSVYAKKDRKEINRLREKLCIVPLELDDIKKEYEINHGFKLFSGFWKCR